MSGSGKVSWQIGVEQLEDALGSIEVPQRMLTEITQACSCRQRVPGQVLRGQGEEDLAAVGRRKQA